MIEKPVVVYVHGLYSLQHTWEKFSSALANIIDAEHRLFRYHSPVINLSLTSRIPDIDVIARKLLAFVREAADQCPGPLFLLGQSFGCLVIQRYLLICQSERPDLLDRTRLTILFGPPNSGSDFLRGLRWWVYRILPHPQERILRPYDLKIAEIQRGIVKNFLFGQQGGFRRRIAFYVFVGERDAVVPLASAMGHFQDVEIVEGDHSSLIQDVSQESQVVIKTASLIRQALVAPFTYHQSITIRPIHPNQPAEVRAVCELQNLLFGDHEKITEQHLRACLLASYEGLRQYKTECVALYDGDELVGFSLFSYDYQAMYVGFVCVDSNRTHLLADHLYDYLRRFARERGSIPIFFEVTEPGYSADRETDTAKIRRFLGLGAKFIGGISYAAPDMAALNQGQISLIPNRLMVFFPSGSPAFLTRDRVVKVVDAILTYFYFDWFWQGQANPDLESKRLSLLAELTRDFPERCSITSKWQ